MYYRARTSQCHCQAKTTGEEQPLLSQELMILNYRREGLAWAELPHCSLGVCHVRLGVLVMVMPPMLERPLMQLIRA